jgi:hypothetical protein
LLARPGLRRSNLTSRSPFCSARNVVYFYTGPILRLISPPPACLLASLVHPLHAICFVHSHSGRLRLPARPWRTLLLGPRLLAFFFRPQAPLLLTYDSSLLLLVWMPQDPRHEPRHCRYIPSTLIPQSYFWPVAPFLPSFPFSLQQESCALNPSSFVAHPSHATILCLYTSSQPPPVSKAPRSRRASSRRRFLCLWLALTSSAPNGRPPSAALNSHIARAVRVLPNPLPAAPSNTFIALNAMRPWALPVFRVQRILSKWNRRRFRLSVCLLPSPHGAAILLATLRSNNL